jgi:diguanylate cyclase (GGDEF)-like protein
MHQADSYSRQLTSGFPALRVEAPVEREFRGHYAARGLSFVRVSLAVALLFLGVVCLLDWRFQPSGLATEGTAIRAFSIAPMALLALLTARSGWMHRHLERWLLVAAALMSTGGVLLGVHHELAVGVLEVGVLTMFIYLLLGLRFYWCVALALPPTVALILAHWGDAGVLADAAYAGAFLLAINAVGATASYRLEHSARTMFLEREIVNVLAGADTATGISNRRLFAKHLQSIRRQANRDKRSLALLLIEVGHYEEFDAHYGQHASEAMLRRVAHTLLRGARRPLDCAARLDGPRFVLVLYDSARAYVERLAAELRDNIALLDIAHAAAPKGAVAINIGAALSPVEAHHDADALLRLAEQALQAAKGSRRDGVVVRSILQPDGPTVTTGPWRAREISDGR